MYTVLLCHAFCESIHRTISDAETAPLIRATSAPFLNKAIVGILLIRYRTLVLGAASVSSLANRTRLDCLAAAANCGPITLQGPHHSAQKSTTTGSSVPSTYRAKLSSVKLTGSACINSCLHFPQTGWSSRRSSGTRFLIRHSGHTSCIANSIKGKASYLLVHHSAHGLAM